MKSEEVELTGAEEKGGHQELGRWGMDNTGQRTQNVSVNESCVFIIQHGDYSYKNGFCLNNH